MNHQNVPLLQPGWLVAGALNALVSVAAGAIGAHALRNSLPDSDLNLFETAARYQMYHALGMIAVAWVAASRPSRLSHLAGSCFGIGILFFCGALYGIPLSGVRSLGQIAPIGGIAFMAGWLLLAIAALLAGRRRAASP